MVDWDALVSDYDNIRDKIEKTIPVSTVTTSAFGRAAVFTCRTRRAYARTPVNRSLSRRAKTKFADKINLENVVGAAVRAAVIGAVVKSIYNSETDE